MNPPNAVTDPAPKGPPEQTYPAPDPDVLLTRDEASVELAGFGIRMNRATLARAWSTGTPQGPPCRHVRGKPLYPKAALLVWAQSQVEPLARSARERDLIRRAGRSHAAP